MPETNETSNSDKEILNNSPKAESLKENPIDKKRKTYKTRYSKSSNYKKHQYPKPNVIVYPKDHDSETVTQAKRANKLTIISIYVNTGLLLLTLIALGITWQSVDVAKQTLSHTKKKDNLDYIRDTANDRQQREKDKITTELALQAMSMQEVSTIAQGKTAKTAAEAYKLQMQNIELYKKALESEYQSDLTIKAAYLTQASPNQLIEGVCQFIATGKVPVKADSLYAYVYFAAKRNLKNIYNNPQDSLFYRIQKLDPSDEQFNNNVPTDTEIFINKPLILHQSFFDALKEDIAVIIYCGKVVYTNEATGKKRYLLFAITLPTPESISGNRNDKTFSKISIKYGDVN